MCNTHVPLCFHGDVVQDFVLKHHFTCHLVLSERDAVQYYVSRACVHVPGTIKSVCLPVDSRIVSPLSPVHMCFIVVDKSRTRDFFLKKLGVWV